MAKIKIKMIRAYDTSNGGFMGTSVPDMFRALNGVTEIESGKCQEIIDKATELADAYHASHPNESFMPCVTVISGRKPRGFDKETKQSNPLFRKYLKAR